MGTYIGDDIRQQVKPFSGNAFVRFFQKLYRGWLLKWYTFSGKKPQLAKLIYTIAFFCIFSMGTAILQFILMTFMPYAFSGLNNGPWGVPYVPMEAAGGQPYIMIGDVQGLGYFIAFEIATFITQCVNFPLQRNITYHSHGNPWFQAMWYFIGWVLVSLFTSAIWGVFNCFLLYWGVNDVVIGLLKNLVTCGISLVIFFFIFMIIFPDNDKVAKSARRRYERVKNSGAAESKINAAEEKMRIAEHKAVVTNAEKELRQAKIQASSSAMLYLALLESSENVGDKKELLQERYENARSAIEEKNKAQQRFDMLLKNENQENTGKKTQ